MALLTTADFPAVRALLDISVDERSLPDTVILLAPFAPEAEARVLDRVTDAADRTGDEARHLHLAAIALCAALLAPSMPSLTSESVGPSVSVSRAPVDWPKRASYLQGVFESEMDAVLPKGTVEDTTKRRPLLFSLAPGRRGF
jgi:hypothetical protein